MQLPDRKSDIDRPVNVLQSFAAAGTAAPATPSRQRAARHAASQYGSTAGSSVVLAPMRAAAVLPLRAAGRCVAAAARPKAGMLP